MLQQALTLMVLQRIPLLHQVKLGKHLPLGLQSLLTLLRLGPGGDLKARGIATNDPEVAYLQWDSTGTWVVRVRLAGGAANGPLLHLHVPAAILS